MKKYKALMLDMDGTTFPNVKHGWPSQTVIAAVSKASKKVTVCAVTGRYIRSALPLFNALGLSGPSIISGGSQIINSRKGTIIWRKIIPAADALQISRILSQMDLTVRILDTFNVESIFSPNLEVGDSLLISIADISLQRAKEVSERLSQFKNIAVNCVLSIYPDKVWLQITNLEATKQYGVLKVAQILSISPSEIIGVGDGYNDFPLLMACGLKIAMGNAVEKLKTIADYVAPSVTEDGVAWVIDRFILGNAEEKRA